ncbi:hypothetical protein L0N33_18510, partial [Roseburia faecis]|nr:hypothetical protein [Roseburia faecis]
YRTPGYPFVPLFALISSGLSCLLIWFDPQQRIALYWTLPFVLICYLGYWWWQKRHPETADTNK